MALMYAEGVKMVDGNKAWINIDRPTKVARVHRPGGCVYERNKAETPHKGVGSLKRDGGWLEFPSMTCAKEHCDRTLAEPARRRGLKKWQWKRCSKCFAVVRIECDFVANR